MNMSNQDGSSRRDFLKQAAAGAVVLGAESGRVLAQEGHAGKSKVVVARDLGVRKSDNSLDAQRVAKLLDKAMMAYAGGSNPVAPWKRIVKPGEKVCIKVNTIAGPGLSTNLVLVQAVCERLQQAGVKAGDIIVWDRTNHELQRAGYAISVDDKHLRCFGTDSDGYGYEEVAESHGAVTTKLSTILTRHCDVMINMPVLKNHGGAGVTLAMKNMYGVIQNPNNMHGGGCNPFVADVNMLEAVRKKMRLTIVDGFAGIYEGGPGYHPEHVWNYNGLLVAEDRVALDHTGWGIIESKRAEMGMKSLDALGKTPKYIATAADASHGLGTNDPSRIAVVEV
jgi:uncharacterized protein (DUF362 family)